MKQPRSTPARPRSHAEALRLLPWLANGTLEYGEQSWVQAHLKECAECSSELARCKAEARRIRNDRTAAPTPHPIQLARLLVRIDALEERHEKWWWPKRVLEAISAACRTAWQSSPAVLRWAVSVQTALVAGLIAAYFAASSGRDTIATNPQFRTLSTAASATATASLSSDLALRLVFDEEASEAEIRRILLSVRAEIRGGPSPTGTYLVNISGVKISAEEHLDSIDSVLRLLRSESAVRFAEPILDPVASTPTGPSQGPSE